MSTRGLIGLRKDNEDKIMYNHFDSYPEGLGANFFEEIKNSNTQELSAVFYNMVAVDEDKRLSSKEYDYCVEKGLDVSSDNWYSILHEFQGTIKPYVEGFKYYIDEGSFIANSLFCEYAYIANLDTNMFEVYKGFNMNPNANGRYASMQTDNEDKYYGVVLICEISFEDMKNMSREEFIEKVTG